jgi:hypothetical protein
VLFVIGWTSADYGTCSREFLPNALAALFEEGELTGCLAALPKIADERNWILSLLASAKRVASIRTGVLVNSATLSVSDLTLCDQSGLDEVVIIQEATDSTQAIEAVRAYERACPSGRMEIRVWLDGVRGRLLSQVCAWKHGTQRITEVELSPFQSQQGTARESPEIIGSQPFRCEWLNSALTLTSTGVVLPCPAHIALGESAEPSGSGSNVLARHAALLTTAGSTPKCRSCQRLARFTGAEGLSSATEARQTVQRLLDPPSSYQDNVRCDSNTLSTPDRVAAIRALVCRIRLLDSEAS